MISFVLMLCMQVGSILGRQGCVVKEIMSLSGTVIQVSQHVCECVCVLERERDSMYVCVCVCVCACNRDVQ